MILTFNHIPAEDVLRPRTLVPFAPPAWLFDRLFNRLFDRLAPDDLPGLLDVNSLLDLPVGLMRIASLAAWRGQGNRCASPLG